MKCIREFGHFGYCEMELDPDYENPRIILVEDEDIEKATRIGYKNKGIQLVGRL